MAQTHCRAAVMLAGGFRKQPAGTWRHGCMHSRPCFPAGVPAGDGPRVRGAPIPRSGRAKDFPRQNLCLKLGFAGLIETTLWNLRPSCVMFWPGMGDPRKRKKTLRFLIITAAIGISVGLASTFAQQIVDADNPLKVCIDDRDTPYRITATLELFVDGIKAEIPANVGNINGCKRSLYTLSDDGTIYAEWEEEYPFEIGHFLWIWDFPHRDMEESKSRFLVDGRPTDDYIHAPLKDGSHYRAEFTSKSYDDSKDTDFLPPDL
ncbi:hypothetical protein CENSYa_0392 [Cenarchaeum symbiosum A]|uniref:Uncharacterized protein n=1 Tax=Cenarchaeum symbiosum (strain A) TaxID=414004 RepID=A0RUL1_CENSY|nr:hypothetical protein CENSYa_0392 [Cenarchaeum symbiosum A]